MSTTTEERLERLFCTGCDRVIGWCSLCDRGSCAERICYRCIGLALKEITPQPHAHGG